MEAMADNPPGRRQGKAVKGSLPSRISRPRRRKTLLVKSFEYEGHTLSYEVHGRGPRLLVYMNGLLLDTGINRRLADALAEKGNRVVLLDLLGHGRSDKPRHASAYRMDLYARQLVALLDALEAEQAVLGGPSLGANVSLLAAAAAPERVRGMVIEMPVLESAVPSTAAVFIPLLTALRYARPLARVTSAAVRALPRSGFDPLDSVMNALSLYPEEMAAILHGVLMGPIAPTYEERTSMHIPTLVVGHRLDLIHPFSDAAKLADQLPDGHLARAHSVIELRLRPRRLSTQIGDFLDEVWSEASSVREAAG